MNGSLLPLFVHVLRIDVDRQIHAYYCLALPHPGQLKERGLPQRPIAGFVQQWLLNCCR